MVGPPGRRARPGRNRGDGRPGGVAVGPRPGVGAAAGRGLGGPLRPPRQRHPRGGRVRRHLLGAEVGVGVVGADRRPRPRRGARPCGGSGAGPSGAVRGHHPGPGRRRAAAPRHTRPGHGLIRPGDVPGGRPAVAHPRRDLREGASSGRAVAGAGRPLPERQAAGPRRAVPVGAARRADPPLRGGMGADRQRPGRDRRRPRRAAGGVLQARRPGRRPPGRQAGSLPGTGRTGPDPLGAGRHHPGGGRRLPLRPRPAPTSTTWWAGGATKPPSSAGPPPAWSRSCGPPPGGRRPSSRPPSPTSSITSRRPARPGPAPTCSKRSATSLRPCPGYRAGGGRPPSSGPRTGSSSCAPAWTRRHRAAPPGPPTDGPCGSPRSRRTSPANTSSPRKNASWPTPSTPTPSRPARRPRWTGRGWTSCRRPPPPAWPGTTGWWSWSVPPAPARRRPWPPPSPTCTPSAARCSGWRRPPRPPRCSPGRPG